MVGGTVEKSPRARSVLLVVAVAVIIGSAVGSTSSMLTWRAEQRESHVRLDVLGRERALVSWLVADTERVIGEGDATGLEAIDARLRLLRESWLVARDGGAELGLDLRPSGRHVVGWPVLHAEYGSVELELFAYADRVEALIGDDRDHRSELPELRATAANIVAQLSVVVRAASDEALADNGFIWSALLLVVAVGSLVGTVAGFIYQGRRRIAAQVAQAGAIRASEARNRALVTGLPLPVAIQGAVGILAANDAAAKLFGVDSPEDLIGVHFESFANSGIDSPIDRFASFGARADAADEYQIEVQLPSGRRTLQVHRRVVELEGEVVEMLVAIDVTDQLAAAAELAAAADLHRFLSENASERLIRATLDGQILYASQASGCTLELDSADLVGANIIDITHPDDRTIAQAALDDALATGASVDADVRIATAAADHYAWVKISAHCVIAADGLLELHLSMDDIRERRAAEIALANTELIKRLILDRIDEGVVLHGLDVGVIRANKAATDMLGVVAGPVPFPVQLHQHVESFEVDGTPLDPDDTPTKRALLTGQPAKGRILQYRRPDGSARWMQVDAYPMPAQIGGSTAPVLMTILDITAEHEAATRLAMSEQRLRLVIENSRELIAVVDLAGILRFVSPSALQILGHDPDTATGTDLRDYIHPDDYADVIKMVMGRSGRRSVRVRVRHIDGSTRHLETFAQIITDDHDQPTSVLLSSRDITERLEIERRLESEHRLLHATFESVHAGVLAIDRDGRIIEANTSFCALIGTQAGIAGAGDVFELNRFYTIVDADGEELDTFDRPLGAALQGRTVVDIPLQLVRADGTRFQVLASASPIAAVDDSEVVDGAVLTIHDVTALRAAEAELRRSATVDALTGLPNRLAVVEHLAGALDRQRRTPERLAVLFLDLDGFKAVNDRLGHEAGDELLASAGRRIRGDVRPGDLVGRYGGDEFVIIVENLTNDDEARHLANRIERSLSQPFPLTAGEAHIGGSVGIAQLARLAIDATLDTVLAVADAAMYDRKRQRKLTSHAR